MGETRILSLRVSLFICCCSCCLQENYYTHIYFPVNENSESNRKYPSHVVCTFGVASGLANADLQAMQKFANDPTQWNHKMGKCPMVVLELTDA